MSSGRDGWSFSPLWRETTYLSSIMTSVLINRFSKILFNYMRNFCKLKLLSPVFSFFFVVLETFYISQFDSILEKTKILLIRISEVSFKTTDCLSKNNHWLWRPKTYRQMKSVIFFSFMGQVNFSFCNMNEVTRSSNNYFIPTIRRQGINCCHCSYSGTLWGTNYISVTSAP